jgi:hypothetical protein
MSNSSATPAVSGLPLWLIMSPYSTLMGGWVGFIVAAETEEKAFDVLSEVLMDDPDDESDPEGDMRDVQELTTWKKEASRRRIATTSIYMEACIVLASRTDL